jgi:hypothetical protein
VTKSTKANNKKNQYEADFLNWDTNTRLTWGIGLCVLAIGAGDLRSALFTFMDRIWRTAAMAERGEIERVSR